MNNMAYVVVDLVNDFVNGKFGSKEAAAVASKTAGVLRSMNKIPIIFTMDSHIKNDPEFKVWGEHCIVGTEGSELVKDLEGIKGFKVRKRHFDSFHDSDLDGLLRALNVNKIYVSGISTDICVLHTAAGAYFRYYEITVIDDLCASIDPAHHERALEDMKRNYGARIIDSDQFLKEVRN